MHSDLYTTVAQVLPVLLLALMWDSAYLEQLRGQQRPSRRLDPDGGFRWTKPRVRAYTLSIAILIMADVLLVVLVLAGAVPDTALVRALVVAGLVVALASLMTDGASEPSGAARRAGPCGARRLAVDGAGRPHGPAADNPARHPTRTVADHLMAKLLGPRTLTSSAATSTTTDRFGA
ncbi:hypothetical protein [Frankia gtarii]|uniref:hypothetical protein n=1 Tax=Frankia gtarii TaxID=2950102 RepID=UPI0021BEBC81|nr:hypothetical protein [Frankia gtarii]